MPVIIVGADTEAGMTVLPALDPASGEIRVFVTDVEVADKLRGRIKVAVGDLSDGSHVGGAALGAFCAVAIAHAAFDERERHFASTPAEVFAQWADGLRDAGIGRVIVVGTEEEIPQPDPLSSIGADYVVVTTDGITAADIAAKVAAAEATPS